MSYQIIKIKEASVYGHTLHPYPSISETGVEYEIEQLVNHTLGPVFSEFYPA